MRILIRTLFSFSLSLSLCLSLVSTLLQGSPFRDRTSFSGKIARWTVSEVWKKRWRRLRIRSFVLCNDSRISFNCYPNSARLSLLFWTGSCLTADRWHFIQVRVTTMFSTFFFHGKPKQSGSQNDSLLVHLKYGASIWLFCFILL